MPVKSKEQKQIRGTAMILDDPKIYIDAKEGGIKFNKETGTVDSVMILTVTTKVPFKFLPTSKDNKESIYKKICDVDLTL